MVEKDVNRYLTTLIEEVALLRKQQCDYDTIWTFLGEGFGADRNLWNEFCKEAKMRFCLLWSEEDCLLRVSKNKHPTPEHWKLLTKVLIIEDEDMANCTHMSEYTLLRLVMEVGLDPIDPTHLPLWHVVQQKYTATGKTCPAVVLQRRMVRWLSETRATLRARWYDLLAGPVLSGRKLHLQALNRYATVIAANPCQWSQFVADGLVVDKEYIVVPEQDQTQKNFQRTSVNMLNRSKIATCDWPKNRSLSDIVQLDGQNDNSDDEDDEDEDVKIKEEINEENETNENRDKDNYTIYDDGSPNGEGDKLSIKIEFEEETFHLVQEDDLNMKPIARDIQHSFDIESDENEVIPTAHMRVLLASVNTACMLATCCIVRRNLLTRSHALHVSLNCACCCAACPEPLADKHLSLIRLPRVPNLQVYTLVTANGSITGEIRPAHELTSTCAIKMDKLLCINEYPHNEILCLPFNVAWAIDNYLLVGSRAESVDRSILYAFGNPGLPMQRVLLDSKDLVRRLLLPDTVATDSEAYSVYYCFELEHSRKHRRVLRAHVAIAFARLPDLANVYDLRVVNLTTREVVQVLAVGESGGPAIAVRRGVEVPPKMHNWDRNPALKSRIHTTPHRGPEESVSQGSIFPGPRSKLAGVSRIKSTGRMAKNDRVLDLATLNYLPKLLPLPPSSCNLTSLLEEANMKLLRKTISIDFSRDQRHPSKRVKNKDIYKIAVS